MLAWKSMEKNRGSPKHNAKHWANNWSFPNLLSYFLISVSFERKKNYGNERKSKPQKLGLARFSAVVISTKPWLYWISFAYKIVFSLSSTWILYTLVPTRPYERGFSNPIMYKGTFINDVLDRGTVVLFLKHFDKYVRRLK